MKLFAMPLLGLLMLLQDDCGSPTTDKKQAAQQEQLSSEAAAQVGMPGITTFTEKRMVRMLYELRDKNVATFSYVMDLNGHLWHVCDSVGYGLPYGVQFTNPLRPAKTWETDERGNITLPQAEPNGLFMPPTAEGTWIMCAGPKGAIDPVYVEPRVVVSPHKLHATGDWQGE
jgi:hypothetical protein